MPTSIRLGFMVFLFALPYHLAAQQVPTTIDAGGGTNKLASWADLKPVAIQAHVFVETPALTKLPPESLSQAEAEGGAIHEIPNDSIYHGPKASFSAQALDPVIQSTPTSPNIPSPTLTFEGINNHCNCVPPDTNGSVGPSNYVEIVNTHIQVFNKSTGATQTGVIAINSLFAGLGDACSATDDGDPVVLYDPLADRWIITQFADVSVGPPYYMSIAISKTPDPTGAYYAYCFQMPNSDLNDYPKFGVWPDGYYMTDNQFSGNTFAGAGVFAFDRAKMLAGDPTATYIYFNLNSVDSSLGGVLPSDLDGPPPPVGTPNYFSCIQGTSLGDAQNALRLFQFHADFVNPGSATFTERAESPLAVAAFTAFSPSTAAIPQSGTSEKLDSLADRLMHRLQYRNFTSYETLVVNHTVNGASSQAGIRYYQLRRSLPGGNFGIYDQATFAPDLLYRWMGSAALDYLGNMAVGYSVSSTTNFPSIRYAGRLVSDPTNGLFQGEASLQTGAGSQTGFTRWGDYSGLSVDPSDDTTFWYTTEYYGSSSSGSWQTRVGRFQIATNSAPAPRGTLQGTVTDASTGLPISNVVVRTTSGFFRVTSATGTYSMTVPPGTYTVFATSGLCGGAVTNGGVVVSNGGTTTQNLSLGTSGLPLITANGATLITEGCIATNGVIDPGETVTVSFGLQNNGCGNSSNLVATLQATGGVTSPSGPQTYGILTNGGTTVNRPFTFTANGVCGSNIAATLQLQTNSANYGTVAFTFNLGVVSAPLSQNFDGVTAPTLPAGWTTSAGGAESLWVSSATLADTAPNAAFSPDPTSIGSNTLVSPVIPIATATAKLTFRNNYSLETSYDGGVLDIKIGGGSFQDIVTAGGTFTSGGYNYTISSSYGNPIHGRSAWSGNSGGFITTAVNLPAAAVGQNIQLRWMCGSDSSIGYSGWYIDSISINDGIACCVGSTNHPPVVSAAAISPSSPTTTNILIITGISTNDPDNDPITLAYQWQQSTNNVAFANIAFVANTLPATATIAGDFYRVVITPNDGHVDGVPFTTASVAVPADADGNGINDDWEVQYFGHIGIDPNGDADGTGQNNLFKYVAGLDPTNHSSVFLLQIIAITNQMAQDGLLFNPLAIGRTYTPEFNTDLLNGTWLPLMNYSGPVTNGNQITVTDTNAVEPNKFYRIDINLP